MKKLLLLILLVAPVPGFSQEFRLLTFTDYYGQIEPTTDYDNLRQRTYIRPEFTMDFLDYMGYFNVSGEFYYDFFSSEDIPNFENILREFYFSFYPDWGDITIGQKLINKGKVDVFSPLNAFNGSYRELLSLDEPYQSKRGDLQLEASYYINDENSIELLYIPFPRPDYQGKGELDFIADGSNYTLNKGSAPYLFTPSHSLFLTYNYYGYNFDIQGAYYNYIEQGYNYSLDYSNSEIDKIYNRVHTIGGAISTSISSFSLVEEVAFNLTEDFDGNEPGIKNSDITFNTQLTRTLFGRTYAQVNMVYQHVFNYDKGDSELEEAINDVHLQPTDNILFFIFHLHDSFLREKLYLALNAGFFFSTDVYVAPRASYRIKDNLIIETGADIYTGEYENKLLEEHLGGDNFYIRLKFEL